MSKKIDRAGVIPYYIDESSNIKMMFMRPSDSTYGGDAYQIAKGKVEEGETNEEAAFREAGEELGLFSGNINKKYPLGNFLGRTMVYVARISETEMFGDPCDETESTKWMTADQFQESGRDLHRPVVKAAVRKIKEAEGL